MTEILVCLTCNVLVPDRNAFENHRKQEHEIYAFVPPVATQVSPPTEAVGVGNGREAAEWQVSEGRDVICPECGHPFETGPIPVEVSPPTPEAADQVLTALTILRERMYLGVSVAEALKIARLPRPCQTCHGHHWVTRSESNDLGIGGMWNEPCPDCSSPPPEPGERI